MAKRSKPRKDEVKAESTGAIFGRNLRRHCESRSLTVEMISERLGFDRKRVERLLAGELVPGLAVLGEISRKLEIPPQELVHGLGADEAELDGPAAEPPHLSQTKR